jgi:hypothetical protein
MLDYKKRIAGQQSTSAVHDNCILKIPNRRWGRLRRKI